MCLEYWNILSSAVTGMGTVEKIAAVQPKQAGQLAAAVQDAGEESPQEYADAWAAVAKPWQQASEGTPAGELDTGALKSGALVIVEACRPFATPAATASPPEAAAPSTAAAASPQSVAAANAVRKAKQYLSFSAFSPSRLIQQLEYEGFTSEEATAAVEGLDVDWNAQAVLKAQQYLEMSGFSRSRLIQQLEFEGFSTEQASAAADAVGL